MPWQRRRELRRAHSRVRAAPEGRAARPDRLSARLRKVSFRAPQAGAGARGARPPGAPRVPDGAVCSDRSQFAQLSARIAPSSWSSGGFDMSASRQGSPTAFRKADGARCANFGTQPGNGGPQTRQRSAVGRARGAPGAGARHAANGDPGRVGISCRGPAPGSGTTVSGLGMPSNRARGNRADMVAGLALIEQEGPSCKQTPRLPEN
jgi:hypothetical protein